MGTFNAVYTIGYQNGAIIGAGVQGPHTQILTDGDADTTFEIGDNVDFFGTYSFVGTVSVDGQDWPYFQLDSDTQFTFIAMDVLPVSPPATASANGVTFNGACFAPGTLIATPLAETRVENLSIGDDILVQDGSTTKVRWIGVASKPTAIAGDMWSAVRIRAGALGQGVPHSDLTLTADHGMVIDGMVINASALVNNDTIFYVPLSQLPNRVTYYHIETENHDVIFANGAPAETFMDAAGRQVFDNHQQYLDLYGTERVIPELKMPRIASQRMLPEAIKSRLGITTQTQPRERLKRA